MKTKQKIISHCKHLHLIAVSQNVHQLADQAAIEGISFLEFAGRLLETEVNQRHQNEMIRKVIAAKTK